MKPITLVVMVLVAGARPLIAQHAQHFRPPPTTAPPPSSIPVPCAPTGPASVRDSLAAMDAMSLMDSVMTPVRWMASYAPERLLGRGRDLGLTPDQEAALQQLRQESRNEHDSAHVAARASLGRLSTALEVARPDVAAAGAHFDAMLHAMSVAHGIELRVALVARALLTDTQRRQVEAWRVTSVPEVAPAHRP